MEFSNNQQTKYFALQILESVIKTRWKVLPRNQCEGIKKYIVGLIIKTSSDPALLEKEKTYLNKLNMILVQVIIPTILKLVTDRVPKLWVSGFWKCCGEMGFRQVEGFSSIFFA